ncbi:MAG: glucosyltransferase domain-containing protein [Lachnospiraceae bacterium]|nr:glucosyltransferase domain-containing protein [Lachnospiraceae bacterium]
MSVITKEINKSKLIISLSGAIAFYLFAHGFRFSNMLFSGDALFQLCQNDYAWQIALGRFMHPFLVFVRGSLTSPWLIGWLSAIWIGLSVYLISDYLKIEKPLFIILCAAIMTGNPVFISLNSAFLQVSDFYALALLLSVAAVWFTDKWFADKRKWYLLVPAIFSIVFSLGIYQAYLCVTVGLVMIKAIKALSEDDSVVETSIKVAVYGGITILSCGLYFIIWKTFQKALNIWTADSYNGLSDIDEVIGTGFFSSVASAYKNVIDFIVNPEVFYSLTFRSVNMSILWIIIFRISNALIIFATIYLVLINNIKKKATLRCLLQVALMALLPLGINIVCIISQGMQHTLMIYGMLLIYIFSISEFSAISTNHGVAKPTKWIPSFLCIVPIVLLIWNNCVYANQVYLKKALQQEATTSLLSRMINDIENMEGYVLGETPVALSGNLRSCKSIPTLENFETIQVYGMGDSLLTYGGSENFYINYILNVDMNLVSIAATDEVKKMPCYPDFGSIKYIDDIIVVKISD